MGRSEGDKLRSTCGPAALVGELVDVTVHPTTAQTFLVSSTLESSWPRSKRRDQLAAVTLLSSYGPVALECYQRTAMTAAAQALERGDVELAEQLYAALSARMPQGLAPSPPGRASSSLCGLFLPKTWCAPSPGRGRPHQNKATPGPAGPTRRLLSQVPSTRRSPWP